MGLPLRSPVAKLSCEAATEENAKRRSFMPRTQVTGKANFSPGITSGLPIIRRIPQMFAQGSSEEELCVICEGLFVPQRDHGIHTGGAACGNVAGRQRSKREHHGDADISERIAGTYTE
jgi:hypothetical protein